MLIDVKRPGRPQHMLACWQKMEESNPVSSISQSRAHKELTWGSDCRLRLSALSHRSCQGAPSSVDFREAAAFRAAFTRQAGRCMHLHAPCKSNPRLVFHWVQKWQGNFNQEAAKASTLLRFVVLAQRL